MGKVQTCFTMSGREERAFGLDHSLHASFFEVKTSGAEEERLIDIIGEGVGDLDSIFCPLSGDEMDEMVDIGGGKAPLNDLQWPSEAQNSLWSKV